MKYFLLFLTQFCYFLVFGQETKIVFFKEEAKQVKSINFSKLVSQKSIDRRDRQDIKFNLLDVPVKKAVILQLSQIGKVLNVSKWLNAATIKTTLSVEELFEQYSFIERIKVIKHSSFNVNKLEEKALKGLNYGLATEQVEQINLNCLHDLGYTGEGVYLAVLDAGFRNMDTVSYFDSIYLEGRVLDSFNFVNSDSTIYNFSGHGTAVSSCIVGEKSAPEEYLGTAIDVELALYLSEDVSSETEVEEFNLVVALERCDSVGVDVVNISLGYFEFDDSTTNHIYSDLDGVTTIAAQGVNIAATKGIFIVSSAGNSGPSNISTPCDAIGAFCVGAIDEYNDLAPFSSLGPSADARVKPDVVARGQDAWLITPSGLISQGSGTSFSSPIIAGATACLIQAHPNRTVQEIMNAIRQSANQFLSPDELKGYGVPDFCLANDILNDNTGIEHLNKNTLLIYPVPTNKTLFISGIQNQEEPISINIINTLGEIVFLVQKKAVNGQIKLDISSLSKGVYTIIITQKTHQLRKKISIINTDIDSL